MRIIKCAFFCGILLVFFSACSQEDEVTYQLNTKLVELNCRSTLSLIVTPALQGLSYTSLNTNIATVSAEGQVRAKLVGTTKVVVKDSLNRFVDTVKVVVRSVNTLFDDPYLGFGADSMTVKNNVSIPYFKTYIEPWLAFEITFGGRDASVYYWTYRFDENGKYTSFYLVVKPSEFFNLGNHIGDRYTYMATKTYQNNLDTYYLNPDSTLIIMDNRYSGNIEAIIEFYPATKERIQRVLSDENGHLFF